MKTLSAAIALLLLAPIPATAQVAFEDSLSTIETPIPLESWGSLGGVALDALGYAYVANFHGKVWRIDPEGGTSLLSDALYGASGNAVDSRGRLLQANFNGNTVSRLERDGSVDTVVQSGLRGPVGIAVKADDSFYVCNCAGNFISHVDASGHAEQIADGPLFACPNGITWGPDSTLYVTNYNNDHIVRITQQHVVDRFATVPPAGNAHIAYAKGALYVTKIISSQIARVSMDGESTLVVGSGAVGFDDGPASSATVSRPNGIVFDATRSRLLFNTLRGTWGTGERSEVVLRSLNLASLTDLVLTPLTSGDLAAAQAAYDGYRASPLRMGENTIAESIALGYRLLRERVAASAVAIFEWNAESYPENAAAIFARGDGYRYTGQSAKAIASFARVLEINPEHLLAQSHLATLRK